MTRKETIPVKNQLLMKSEKKLLYVPNVARLWIRFYNVRIVCVGIVVHVKMFVKTCEQP